MLREIMIENVAVIEKAGVQFGAGLNVLSGETGAGKSILIDSINAILGNRTRASWCAAIPQGPHPCGIHRAGRRRFEKAGSSGV